MQYPAWLNFLNCYMTFAMAVWLCFFIIHTPLFFWNTVYLKKSCVFVKELKSGFFTVSFWKENTHTKRKKECFGRPCLPVLLLYALGGSVSAEILFSFPSINPTAAARYFKLDKWVLHGLIEWSPKIQMTMLLKEKQHIVPVNSG